MENLIICHLYELSTSLYNTISELGYTKFRRFLSIKLWGSDPNWLNFPTNHRVPYRVSRYQSLTVMTRHVKPSLSPKLPLGNFHKSMCEASFYGHEEWVPAWQGYQWAPVPHITPGTACPHSTQQVRPRTRQWNLRWLPSSYPHPLTRHPPSLSPPLHKKR